MFNSLNIRILIQRDQKWRTVEFLFENLRICKISIVFGIVGFDENFLNQQRIEEETDYNMKV